MQEISQCGYLSEGEKEEEDAEEEEAGPVPREF